MKGLLLIRAARLSSGGEADKCLWLTFALGQGRFLLDERLRPSAATSCQFSVLYGDVLCETTGLSPTWETRLDCAWYSAWSWRCRWHHFQPHSIRSDTEAPLFSSEPPLGLTCWASPASPSCFAASWGWFLKHRPPSRTFKQNQSWRLFFLSNTLRLAIL